MTDDYELIEQDFDEFIRQGLEAFGLEPDGTYRLREDETA